MAPEIDLVSYEAVDGPNDFSIEAHTPKVARETVSDALADIDPQTNGAMLIPSVVRATATTNMVLEEFPHVGC